MIILSQNHRADDKINLSGRWIKRSWDFPSLNYLPTYHTTALHMNDLTQGYFGEEGMLAYVMGFKDKKSWCLCKHQRMAGSNLGDDIKHLLLETKL
jgi:isocitrate lyase